MKMRTEISLKEVKKVAKGHYRNGYSCSESLVCSILDTFELDYPREIIALSSGFSAGIGKSGCICGALTGGVMALGMFFGRTEPNDLKVKRNHELAKELHDYFKESTGKNATCCHILTKGFDMTKGEHKSHCVNFVGNVAYKTAELIIKELQLINLDD